MIFSQNVFKCKGNPSESFDKKYRKTVFLMGKKAQKEVLFYHSLCPFEWKDVKGYDGAAGKADKGNEGAGDWLPFHCSYGRAVP